MSGPPPRVGWNDPASERRRSAVSLAVLTGVSISFAVLFFEVVRPFTLPLFLAAVFAVLAMPLHERIAARCGGRGWLSALLIIVALLLMLLGPTTACFLAAYRRAADAVALFERTTREPGFGDHLFDPIARLTQLDPHELRAHAVDALREGEQLLFRRAVQAVGDVLSFGLDVCLFLVAGFFFLKDGRSIVRAWEGVTPLDVDHDRRIRQQFAVVCRAVVSSTILAALAQALTFGLGVGLIDLAFGARLTSWLVLLMLLVFVTAMMPVIGAPIVWLPLAGWYAYRHDYLAAAALILVGSVVVGNVDNLVRMAVLQGSAGLHPLLALVSVLGGIQRMGVLGAFIGPVVAGVFVTLLRILRSQLDRFNAPTADPLFRDPTDAHGHHPAG